MLKKAGDLSMQLGSSKVIRWVGPREGAVLLVLLARQGCWKGLVRSDRWGRPVIRREARSRSDGVGKFGLGWYLAGGRQ